VQALHVCAKRPNMFFELFCTLYLQLDVFVMIFNIFALRFERLAEDVIVVLLVAQFASFLKRLRMMSFSPL